MSTPATTPARLAALRRLALYGEIQVGARTGRTLAHVFAEDLVINGLAVFVGPRRIAISDAGKALICASDFTRSMAAVEKVVRMTPQQVAKLATAAKRAFKASDGREESTRPAASRGETLPPSEDPSPHGSADA